MSEYIVMIDNDETLAAIGGRGVFSIGGFRTTGNIVRCMDCKHYYEAEDYHPSGNYVRRCCKYFDAYNDEVEPDGFCKWGEPRGDWITCKCGQEIEAPSGWVKCPSCGRRWMNER